MSVIATKRVVRRTAGLIIALAWLAEIAVAADGSGSGAKRDTVAPAPVAISSLPKLRSGITAYPPPFMAVGRTPNLISPLDGKTINIQTDFGYPGGFSGFADTAVGSIGYPGYRNFTNLDIAYDAEKLCLLVSMPYPVGRKTRANVADPSGDLAADDVFEILIDPRDAQGRSMGPVYRAIGNAAGVAKFDLDLPQIGQVHQPWRAAAKYGSMMWDPMGSWLAAVQIPFADLGGGPHDGDAWGVQMALRYADPKITAVLSPSDEFGDRSRFARVRFDANRRANYRCHWLQEQDIKAGTFCVGGIFSNGANEATRFKGVATLYKGDHEIGSGSFTHDARPLNKYDGDLPTLRFPSQPASASERDTVARVVVVDQQAGTVVYDQFVPYWRAAPGERDWLKQHFAKEFTFQIGPYPSRGDFEFAVDCQTLREATPAATRAIVSASSGAAELARSEIALPPDGKLSGTLHVGRITDGARYEVVAAILDNGGKTLSKKTQTFIRKLMPFETAPRAGLTDIVPPPFTPPKISGGAVACVGRFYTHGSAGLLESLVAAGNELLAAPATWQVRIGAQPAVALHGDEPKLTPHGKGQVDYRQTFSGGGLKLEVTGVFDYDGFYRFSVRLAPAAEPVDLQECRLELPLQAAHATFMEAPIDSLERDWDKGAGLLDANQGRAWDSKRFPFAAQKRKGNMPPYCWVGDDDRGLCYSCASDQGMHNDDARPAVAIDREGQRVVLRAWFVNRPLTLREPRAFEFALQASPFKPLDPGHRLWRCGVSRDQCCYGASGRYFHTGWGIGDYWPTYGRFLDLAKNAEAIRRVRAGGYDHLAASASSCSECGGTPEYKQFWREWGSEMGWDQLELGPLPEWMDKHMKDSGVQYDRYVAVESASNDSPSNVDYRAWWFAEVARHCQTSMIYQDNPPYNYFYQPAIGYGYTRDDGVREPTCATWNAREFMRRALHIAVESGGGNPAPGVYPNVCGAAQPGRSFSSRGLTGEWLQSDRLPLSTLRVWLSPQWGMNIDWLMQEPTAGATLKYWRALCSRLFLLDVTSFARTDTADVASCWLRALDLFWLDDPTVVWHPYYRNPTLQSTIRPTTFVSTYTATGRALFVASNQGADGIVETVAFKNLEKYGAGGMRYFYDAETGEEIETTGEGTIRLFIPGSDYRLVLGFAKPWPFAAKHALGSDDPPAQPSLDANRTVTALCKQLLESPKITAINDAHQLTQSWVQRIVAEFQSDPADFVYLDRAACADVDLGDKQIETALLYSKKRQVLLAVYVNPTDTDRLLKGNAREALNKKVQRSGYSYILDPIRGTSQWNVIDLPAGGGKLELFYSDAADYSSARRGPFAVGTMWTNLRKALDARTMTGARDAAILRGRPRP